MRVLLAAPTEFRPPFLQLPPLVELLLLLVFVLILILLLLPLEGGSQSKESFGGDTIAKRTAEASASSTGSQPWDANIVWGEADTQRKQGLRSALALQGSFTMRPRAASTLAMSYKRRTWARKKEEIREEKTIERYC